MHALVGTRDGALERRRRVISVILIGLMSTLATAVVLHSSPASASGLDAELLKDINPGSPDASARPRLVVNGLAIFGAKHADTGTELWASDGTEAGTGLVKDIRPGTEGSFPNSFGRLESQLVFQADDGSNGLELWITNGTASGTYLLKDLNPGSAGSNPKWFTPFNDGLVFEATSAAHGSEVWFTDGTTSGTTVLDIAPGPVGTSPSEFTPFGSGFVFSAVDAAHGTEAWYSDGTIEGTTVLKDINVGEGSSFPTAFASAPLGPRVVFWADDGSATQLWVTDGTTAGTQLLKDITRATYLSVLPFTRLDERLVFRADDGIHGEELWVTDGTTDGTFMLKDINPGEASSSIDDAVPYGNSVVFEADDGVHGAELWRTDGSATGTSIVADLNPGPGASSPSHGFVYGALLLFSASDGALGHELWMYEPADGVTLVRDINLTRGSFPNNFAQVGSTVIFNADDGEHGFELWRLFVPPTTTTTTELPTTTTTTTEPPTTTTTTTEPPTTTTTTTEPPTTTTTTSPAPTSVTVTSPNGGETWRPRQKVVITWKYDGPGRTVRVELLKRGVVAATVATSTPIGSGGAGSINWTVPAKANQGDDYEVRVRVTGSQVSDTSNQPFSIASKPTTTTSTPGPTTTRPTRPGAIKVTSPNGGETWQVGQAVTVTWKYKRAAGATVRVELLRGSKVAETIAAAEPIGTGAAGSVVWTVPSSLAGGTNYQVRVTVNGSNSSIKDRSDRSFSISS